MKAVILAAGRGKRMGELTQAIPKPMLQVWGKPILEHIVIGLRSAGIQECFIVTGYCAEPIETYFGSGEKWGLRITFARQLIQDGTGRAPELAREFVVPDDFLLTYGDILVKPETYLRMIQRFQEQPFAGLITVTGGLDFRKYGLVLFDSTFCLDQIVEKPTADMVEQLQRSGRLGLSDPFWYNAGVYIFKPLLFDFTRELKKSARGEYELTDALTAMRQAGHRIAGLQIPGRWVDVRDPQVLEALERGVPFADHSRS